VTRRGDNSERFEPVTIHDAVCKAESEKAILVSFPDTDADDCWIPKSQLDDDSEVFEKGGSGKLVIPRWLAQKAGLI
jgi:hypothetical protein